MRFEALYAERDVRSRPFEFGRPVEIALLIEARFDLDRARHLLTALGGRDQGFHEGCVVPDSVGSHLYYDGRGVGCCRRDEVLHAVFETLVGMMHHHVAGTMAAKTSWCARMTGTGIGFQFGSRSDGAGSPAIWKREV